MKAAQVEKVELSHKDIDELAKELYKEATASNRDEAASAEQERQAQIRAAVDPTLANTLAPTTYEAASAKKRQAQMRAGLARQYANPPVAQTERCLRRNLTPERCRALVYWPDEDDASLYPALLANPPPGAPEDHPQFRCQVTYLMSLYLCHSKRWSFAKGFILAGGLRALVGMCAHPNLHLRGQAMETLGALTREELYPWHDPPAAGSSSDAALHARMLELARTPLVPNLVLNYDAPFPGASSLALRTLAFFASYLRLRHCPNNVLRLSDDLLATLERWSTRDSIRATPTPATRTGDAVTTPSRGNGGPPPSSTTPARSTRR